MACYRHWWKATKRTYRVPCRGWWPDGPMGSIKFRVYACVCCDAETGDEIPYSWREGEVKKEEELEVA